MRRIVLIIALVCGTACAHSGGAKSGNETINVRETLGYAQIKTPYAAAAWDEGNIAGVKKALDNKHSKTGKPYPCWNALKPFHGKNLPVSLKLAQASDPKLQSIVSLAQLPPNKLDQYGRDGVISTTQPAPKSGFTTWKIDQVYQKASRRFDGSVIGLVDISESMKVSAKMRTLMGLKDSNIQFSKIYTFSQQGSMREVSVADIARQTPRGSTAIYDNLKEFIEKYPGSEILVITDGKDNKSKSTLDEVQQLANSTHTRINFVLTGKHTDKHAADLAYKTGGLVLRDLNETGDVIQPALDVAVVQ